MGLERKACISVPQYLLIIHNHPLVITLSNLLVKEIQNFIHPFWRGFPLQFQYCCEGHKSCFNEKFCLFCFKEDQSQHNNSFETLTQVFSLLMQAISIFYSCFAAKCYFIEKYHFLFLSSQVSYIHKMEFVYSFCQLTLIGSKKRLHNVADVREVVFSALTLVFVCDYLIL